MISLVIRRLYVHNFRCLENFELPISGQSPVLPIGDNGSRKTTVGLALKILQKIARGTNRIGDLVKPKDFSEGARMCLCDLRSRSSWKPRSTSTRLHLSCRGGQGASRTGR